MDESPLRLPLPQDIVLSRKERGLKERMLAVLSVLNAGHSRRGASAQAGVSYTTVSKWIRYGKEKITHPLYPWFFHEIQCAEGIGESKFADIVIREATEKHNWRAAMFVLQKRYAWTERPALDDSVARRQQLAQLSKTKAETVFVEARTKKLEEDGEEIVLERLRDILNEVRSEVKVDGKEEQVN